VNTSNSADNVLLSIVIPTYKRCRLLARLLETIAPDAERLGVEVCVVDNCSGDGTAERLAVLSAQYPSIRYKVNAETVSIDENMRLAMLMADGIYVFPLGDDDILPSGSLLYIIDELAHDPDMLSLGGQSISADFTPLPKLQYSEDVFGQQFHDPRNALLKLNVQPFGSFVIKRKIIAFETFSRYSGTYHAYLGIVWDGLAQKFLENGSVSIRCSSEPLVYLNSGAEKTWTSSMIEVFFVKVPQYLTLLPDVLQAEAKILLEAWLRDYVNIIKFIDLRRSKHLTRFNYREVQKLLDQKPAREMAFIMLIPEPLLKISRSLIKRWLILQTICSF
jgi:glycosyltransferase involved in cell wall biosynthesis